MDPIPEDIIGVYKKMTVMMTYDTEALLGNVFQTLDENLEGPSKRIGPDAPHSLLVVLDGMDELPSQQSRARALKTVYKLSNLNNRMARFRIRMLLFSRERQEIENLCSPDMGWRHLKIPRSCIDHDIKYTMERRLAQNDKMSALKGNEREALARQINNKAVGM